MDNMSQPKHNQDFNLDDRLADFTDDVLDGKKQDEMPDREEELLQLKETILHLRTSFPPIEINEARTKQMYVRLKNRIKREEQEIKPAWWKRLFSSPQFVLVGTALGLLLIFVLIFPSLTPAGSSTSATALTPVSGPIAAAVLTGLILIIVWIKRRK